MSLCLEPVLGPRVFWKPAFHSLPEPPSPVLLQSAHTPFFGEGHPWSFCHWSGTNPWLLLIRELSRPGDGASALLSHVWT